ncbi:MAG TPA: DUF2071 domain-containing protein [Thermoanaerobaculia bacterium]|nr:DUF2071 domain-containing protein [Thermoanaerobaculia bacterium]
MMLRAVVRDCLVLNWALPAEALLAPPAPLRYQLHPWNGRDHVFASALLFHHDAVRLSALPLLRVGYPQLNFRLYVLDQEGVPSVLFRSQLMPAWVAPGVRLVARQPAASARLDFPRPSRDAGAGHWRWRAERNGGGTLTVRAWVGSPSFGEGPRVGNWEETVRYIHERPRGYAERGGVLQRVEAAHPPASVWPLGAEVDGDGLLRRLLPDSPSSPLATIDWPALHSSWLCPEMPLAVAFDLVPRVPVVHQLPHPAAGRVTTHALHSLGPAAAGSGAAEPSAGGVLASAA